MKRAVNILLALTLIAFLASAVLFYAFRLEIVRIIVENSVTQKAPSSYPRAKIHSAFDSALEQAKYGPKNKERVMEKLFEISHTLERTQHLSRKEVDDLLRGISYN